jgi:hypothetical protein
MGTPIFDRPSFVLDGFSRGWTGDASEFLALRLDGQWYTFSEDPCDGYRSLLDDVRTGLPEDAEPVNLPAITVTCAVDQGEALAGVLDFMYTFSEDGREVARCGTRRSSDLYYPTCVLEVNLLAMSFSRKGPTQ